MQAQSCLSERHRPAGYPRLAGVQNRPSLSCPALRPLLRRVPCLWDERSHNDGWASRRSALSSSKLQTRDNPMTKPILCLDFDGVIHSYTSGWKGADVIPDPPVPGALLFMYEAQEHFTVAVFSSRSNQPHGVYAMKKYIRKYA